MNNKFPLRFLCFLMFSTLVVAVIFIIGVSGPRRSAESAPAASAPQLLWWESLHYPKTYLAPDGVNTITENEDGTGSMTLLHVVKPRTNAPSPLQRYAITRAEAMEVLRALEWAKADAEVAVVGANSLLNRTNPALFPNQLFAVLPDYIASANKRIEALPALIASWQKRVEEKTP